jgi:hypothetical protein
MMKITSCPLDQRRGAHKVMNLVLLMGIAPLFLKLIFTRSLFFYLSLYPKRREEEDEQVIRHPGSTPSLSVYILAFSLYRRQHPITSVWGHTHTHIGKMFLFFSIWDGQQSGFSTGEILVFFLWLLSVEFIIRNQIVNRSDISFIFIFILYFLNFLFLSTGTLNPFPELASELRNTMRKFECLEVMSIHIWSSSAIGLDTSDR